LTAVIWDLGKTYNNCSAPDDGRNGIESTDEYMYSNKTKAEKVDCYYIKI